MEFRHPEITAAALLPLDGFWVLTARDGTTARSLKIDDAWNCSKNVWDLQFESFFSRPKSFHVDNQLNANQSIHELFPF